MDTFHVTVNRKNLDGIVARLDVLRTRATVVGWPGAGSPLHKTYDSKGALTFSNLTVAQTAAIHEFGSEAKNTPPRPAMKMSIKMYKRDIQPAVSKIYGNVLRGTISGEVALDQLGAFWETKVKRVFTHAPWESLAPRTLRSRLRRGNTSSQPMVDSGHLRETVTHKTVGAGYK
jgi:hypothetical protein